MCIFVSLVLGLVCCFFLLFCFFGFVFCKSIVSAHMLDLERGMYLQK